MAKRETYSEMEHQVNQKIYARALKLLSHKPYSETELRSKLVKYGDEATVSEVIDKLKSLSLLDDLNFSRNFASYRVRTKLLGRVRAAQDLRQRHIPSHIIDQALDEVFTEVDESEVIDRAVDKWINQHGKPRNRNKFKSLYNYLKRRGFPHNLIYDKIKAYYAGYGTGDSDHEERK